MAEFHQMNADEVIQKLESSRNGLNEKEVRERLKKYGLNELKEKERISALTIFLSQFKNFLVIILIIATIISAVFGEIIDAIVILIILSLNAVFGFVQEYKAEKAMQALKKLAAPQAIVLREGKELKILAKELVPGDIILLETGSKVPADCRLIEEINLKIDESLLTGESTPVIKEVEKISKPVPVSDRKNMAFMGTTVSYGRGKAVVISTGMHTEVGRIAEMIQIAEEKKTPLQVRLEGVGKRISFAVIFICALIFLSGILQGNKIPPMFLTAVSLAVAAVPEGLPAIITITLAIGMQRMAKRNAIIRKLPAVETLGCTTFICSDKTGTLTKNEMTARRLYTNNKTFKITGEGYEPIGEFYLNGKKINPRKEKHVSLTLKIGGLCNSAKLLKEREWKVFGDPTEGALITAAIKAGIKLDWKKISEIPFDPTRKYMTTVHEAEGKKIVCTKGAPETVLKLCTHILENGKIRKITEKEREKILKVNEEMAEKALRVLAMAYKEKAGKNFEKNLIFTGLIGMRDPLRKEVKEAVKLCKKAGIKVVMITGDHKSTATAIAKELGILKNKAITGAELDALRDKEFEKIVEEISVYARVSPQHKTKIIKALGKKGHVIAMTGDGVNDAPALKEAHIGIAMGVGGTDVAREASDMVLSDNNFATIVHAVEEGRGIYANIKKFVTYLLSCNSGEVLTMAAAVMITPAFLPLTTIQILWMNLITDGVLALALGVEPFEKNLMQQKPRNPKESMLNKKTMTSVLIFGMVMAVSALFLFYSAELIKAQTIAFTTLVMFQIVAVLTYKSSGFLSNKWLVIAIIASISMQCAVIYLSFLQPFFNTLPLNVIDWAKIMMVVVIAFLAMELAKLIWKKKALV